MLSLQSNLKWSLVSNSAKPQCQIMLSQIQFILISLGAHKTAKLWESNCELQNDAHYSRVFVSLVLNLQLVISSKILGC